MEARNVFGYFVWKITILRQKIIFFPILGEGGACRVRPSIPGSAPAYVCSILLYCREIWGIHKAPMVEKVRLDYFKMLLGVKRCTANYVMIYIFFVLWMGRVPLCCECWNFGSKFSLQIIVFWNHVIENLCWIAPNVPVGQHIVFYNTCTNLSKLDIILKFPFTIL